MKLNAPGASARHKALKTSAFKSGLTRGTAVVKRPLCAVHRRERRHELTLDPGTLGAITGAGFMPAIGAPATLDAAVATFPIVKSKIAADLTTGVVSHSGGLSLTKAGTTTSATDFDSPERVSAQPGGAGVS